MQIGAEHAESNGIQFVTGSMGRFSLLVARLTHAIKWPNRLIISSLNAPAQSQGLSGQRVPSSDGAIERDSTCSRGASDCLCAPEMGQMSWRRDVAF